MKPTFFRSATEFRKWLQRHADTELELLVGFYKTDSGKPSITWPQSVDAALCENKSGIYSYEQRPDALVEPYAGMLAKSATAKKFFEQQPPSYRRAAIWWVISAKKEEARLKRAQTLIDLSKSRQRIPQFEPRLPDRR